MSAVLASAGICEQLRPVFGQAEGVIQFTVQQQTAVGTDGRTMERKLDRSVELEPQGTEFSFTRRVHIQTAALSWLTRCVCEIITLRKATKSDLSGISGLTAECGFAIQIPLRCHSTPRNNRPGLDRAHVYTAKLSSDSLSTSIAT